MRAELMATMAGEPLYRSCGYVPVEEVHDDRGGEAVPLLRMRKVLASGELDPREQTEAT